MPEDDVTPPRVWISKLGYWAVLPLTAISYGACAWQTGPDPSATAFLVQLATVAVTLRVAEVGPRVERAGWAVLVVGAVAAVITTLIGAEGQVLDIALSAASTVAFLAAPVAIVAHQARRSRVDTQALLAAISAYVLVGMSFTMGYNLLALLSSTPVFGAPEHDTLTSQLFFSFSTLTTTGYGNIVPVTPAGQTVAIAEAIVGQLFLIVAVARILSGQLRMNPDRRVVP